MLKVVAVSYDHARHNEEVQSVLEMAMIPLLQALYNSIDEISTEAWDLNDNGTLGITAPKLSDTADKWEDDASRIYQLISAKARQKLMTVIYAMETNEENPDIDSLWRKLRDTSIMPPSTEEGV